MKKILNRFAWLSLSATIFSGCGPLPAHRNQSGAVETDYEELPELVIPEEKTPTKVAIRDTQKKPISPVRQKAETQESPAPPGKSFVENRGCIGVVVPLSGRSRRLGEQLAELAKRHPLALEKEDPSLKGIADEQVGRLAFIESPNASEITSKLEQLAQHGCFGAAGLFETTTAKEAAQAAESLNFPLVMLTVSDAPLKVDGPVFRVLHTPKLVARTLAGAAMARGGRKALVAHAGDSYAKNQTKLFKSAWKQGKGLDAGEITWSSSPDWSEIASKIKALDFDTIFLPISVQEAALLLTHLAAQGIWARGKTPRFAKEKDVREVTVLGPSEWYTENFLKQASRYAEEVLIAVPFAAETARGAPLADLLIDQNRAPTAYDALLYDALSTLESAQKLTGKMPTYEKGKSSALTNAKISPTSAGLDFSHRDALPSLILLTVREHAFTPAE